MKEYKIEYTSEASDGITKFKNAGDIQLLKRIKIFIEELKIHPKRGKGKPKRLKHFPGNHWSRMISKKHRMMYRIFENVVTVQVIRVHGHYYDK